MWRILDIAQPGRTLSLEREAVKVSAEGQEIARIPIRDVQALLVHGRGTTLTLNLADALAAAGAPVVLCGANHAASSVLLPVAGNFEHAGRLHAQAAAGLPMRKRLWAELVREKVRAQAEALGEGAGADAARLAKLAQSVRSGDPQNVEAQAARLYWPRLMGADFRRDREAEGRNAALNYGYAVLRAAMSRQVVASGLSPALGLHHRSRLNPFQLVDDLMEPFRPLVDRVVADAPERFAQALTPEAKATLAGVVDLPLETEEGVLPATRAMERLCASLSAVFQGEAKRLWRPRNWRAARHGVLDFGGDAVGGGGADA